MGDNHILSFDSGADVRLCDWYALFVCLHLSDDVPVTN